MSYSNKSMMTSLENLLSSSLLGEDLSLWSLDLPKNDFGDGASLDTSIQLMDDLVSFKEDQKSFNIMEGDQNNPLPDWMSEKVDVSGWLDVLADRSVTPINELEMDKLSDDELLDSFVADRSPISDLIFPEDCLDMEPMMPVSPGCSIGSGGTAVNSSASSPSPSSPFSLDSDVSSLHSLRETDDIMEADKPNLELLINSCEDSDTFMQLADSLSMHLPIPGEEDIKPLLEKVNKVKSDLQLKIKSESKVSRGKTKSKPVSKERKERKKGQNKEAATRYRQKKKKEATNVSGDLEILEEKNGELKGKVDTLEQEIKYLKDLLEEIFKVKGQIKILKSP